VKRGGPLKRETPLKPGAGLNRGGRLPPRSPKRAAEAPERAQLVDWMLARFPRCQVLPVLIDAGDPSLAAVIMACRLVAVDVHERKTRGRGGSPLNPANCMTACRSCHDWLTRHPIEARALGLVLNSWDSEPSARPDDPSATMAE
jgi:hypothetical protein